MIENYFPTLKEVQDAHNPFSYRFILDDNHDFYVERIFETKLRNLFLIFPNEKERVLSAMVERCKKEGHVVYVGEFEFPQTDVDDKYIYLEIEDITNPLHIFVEDKSRGSDYGD